MAPIVVPTPTQAGELASPHQSGHRGKGPVAETRPNPMVLVRECQKLTEKQKAAPTYLQPDSQKVLLHTADHCLAVVELAVNWAVERLYGVEGLGPFQRVLISEPRLAARPNNAWAFPWQTD